MTLEDRLEQAKMGSRELDVDFGNEVYPMPKTAFWALECVSADEWGVVGYPARAFTTDLDLSLHVLREVGPQWVPSLDRYVTGEDRDDDLWRVFLKDLSDGSGMNPREVQAIAKTPALAICLATLRAKEFFK